MTLFDDISNDCIYEIGRWIEYWDDVDNLLSIIDINKKEKIKNEINTYIFGVFGIENIELCLECEKLYNNGKTYEKKINRVLLHHVKYIINDNIYVKNMYESIKNVTSKVIEDLTNKELNPDRKKVMSDVSIYVYLCNFLY